MSAPNQDLSRLLELVGSLGSKIDGVAKNQDRTDTLVQEMDRRSGESRSRLHEKVEEVARHAVKLESASVRMEAAMEANTEDMKVVQTRVGALEESKRNHDDAIKEMKPSADLVRRWEQRGIGIGIALTTLGVIFGAAAATFREKIFKLFV